MLQTRVTELFGIEHPVIQGGMQWIGLPKMASAVSNAGGLGILTALTQPNPEALRTAIRETRQLTSRPFGVNITMTHTIKRTDHLAFARVAVEEGVRIFETAGQNPKAMVEYLKSNGCIVMHKCTTIRHAKAAERIGVDVISMEGYECAGHCGEDDIGGIVLLARAARELKIPYVGSGGIADGRGLAAALALGASGISMGTRFMCTVEAPVHQNIKNRMLASTERDTVHVFRPLRNTARVFKNSVSTEVVRRESRPDGARFSDLQDLVAGERGRGVYETGDIEAGMWTASVVMGLIEDIPTCKELVERIVRDAEEYMAAAATMKRESQPRVQARL